MPTKAELQADLKATRETVTTLETQLAAAVANADRYRTQALALANTAILSHRRRGDGNARTRLIGQTAP